MLSMGEGCESAVGIRRKCCFPQAILVHTEVSHRTLLWNTSRHVGLRCVPQTIIFVLSVMKFSALATRTISLIRTERNGLFGGSEGNFAAPWTLLQNDQCTRVYILIILICGPESFVLWHIMSGVNVAAVFLRRNEKWCKQRVTSLLEHNK